MLPGATIQLTLVFLGYLLGSTSTVISISSKSASSTASSYSPNYGLIGAHSTRGWRPSSFSGTQYLEFQLSAETYVTSMEIKGATGSNYYVETFTVRFYNSTAGAWVGTFQQVQAKLQTISESISQDILSQIFDVIQSDVIKCIRILFLIAYYQPLMI